MDQSGKDLRPRHPTDARQGVLDLLDFGEGCGEDAPAGISGWVSACSEPPGVDEGNSGVDKGMEVPIKGSDCILDEATDASRVVLKFLVDGVGYRAGNKATGASDEGIGQSRQVPVEYKVRCGGGVGGKRGALRFALHLFFSVDSGHHEPLIDGSKMGFTMLTGGSETFKPQVMRRIINGR